jgi:p-aminobenzoyl-glutamate transporter AbgT
LARFLGDSPLRVIIKLLVVSFLVGLVMHTFGWSPYGVLRGVQNFFLDIWNMGFRAIDRFLGYILLGAAIVVPAFILLRIASYRK